MTRRTAPTNRQMAAAMETAELPMTRPVIQESDAERLVWTRGIADAQDEQGLIDAQIASAERLMQAARREAADIFKATVEVAEKVEARAGADADRVYDATVEALQRRRADLDRKVAGLRAALDASEEPTS